MPSPRRAAPPSRFAFALSACVLAACGGAQRDVVPPTHDVQVSGAQASGNYVFVARRPSGFVGLSSEEGLGMELAKGAVERMADKMDACAVELASKGKLVDGAVRVTVLVRPDGSTQASRVTVAPGDAVAANALLCVMSPLRMLTFAPAPESQAGPGRAFTFDATWGPAARQAPEAGKGADE